MAGESGETGLGMRDPLQSALGILLAGLALCGSAWAQASCAPPDSMKERFSGKPDTAALNDLGIWLGEQKNYTCAADAFATSLEMDPHQKDMPHVAFMLGASLYMAGDVKEAIPALQEAEKFGYRDIKLHLVLADALDSTHSTSDAEMEWRAALEIDPEYSDALDSLSNDLIADSDYKGVVALLDTPRLEPQRTVQQCRNLALAYVREGKLDEAKRVLRDGLNTYPDSMQLAGQLADVLNRIGKKAEAAAVLQIAHARQERTPPPAH